MKNISALLALFTLWTAVITSSTTTFAQKQAVPIAGSLQEEAFKIQIKPGTQPVVGSVPGGVIVPVVNLTIEGLNGDGEVQGIVVEVRGQRNNAASVMLQNGGNIFGNPKNIRSANHQITLDTGFYVNKGGRWDLTVAVRTADLPFDEGEGNSSENGFSVAVVAIITNAEVEGTFPEGPEIMLTPSLKTGRVIVNPAIVEKQNLLPYMSQQWLMGVELVGTGDTQSFPWLSFDIYASGGMAYDMGLSLYDLKGNLMVGPYGLQEDVSEPGRATVQFSWPFNLAKGERKQVYLAARLGDTWVRGGTISAAMVPSKSVSRGDQGRFLVPLAPHGVIAGPVQTVKPISQRYEANLLPIPVGLGTGRNDLIRFSITAPQNEEVVIPGFGAILGWLPTQDVYDNLMLYGFSDSKFTLPLARLQADGAFWGRPNGPIGYQLNGYQHFDRIHMPVVEGRDQTEQSTGIHILPGETAYFVARADVTSTGLFMAYGIAVSDMRNGRSLQFQIRTR